MAQLLIPFAGERAEELAGVLLSCFGTLSRIVSASAQELRRAAADLGDDMADAASQVAAARKLVDAAIRQEAIGESLDPTSPPFQRYLQSLFADNSREKFHVIFCDGERRYLADETVADGGLSAIKLRARPLIARALELGASGFVLAHNHPSGVCRPSKTDIDTTSHLSGLAKALDLNLLDHLIVTRGRAYSMRAGGLL